MAQSRIWQVEAEFPIGTPSHIPTTSDFAAMNEDFVGHLSGATDVQAGLVITPTGSANLMLTARVSNVRPGQLRTRLWTA